MYRACLQEGFKCLHDYYIANLVDNSNQSQSGVPRDRALRRHKHVSVLNLSYGNSFERLNLSGII